MGKQIYLRIFDPLCSRAGKRGYVMAHLSVAERALGKPLPKKAIVHHYDNTLVICESQAYHKFLHKRERALKECGHVNWEWCECCKKWDDPSNMTITKTNRTYHAKCNNQRYN